MSKRTKAWMTLFMGAFCAFVWCVIKPYPWWATAAATIIMCGLAVTTLVSADWDEAEDLKRRQAEIQQAEEEGEGW